MIFSMKIYTKTGDDGTTGLIGGSRVPKSDARIECTGQIDEVNAAIGWAAAVADGPLGSRLRAIQNELFVIGSNIAIGSGPHAKIPTLSHESIARLEREIDAADSNLSPLRNFILPGGGEASARLHLARTICRRAERAIVGFAAEQPVPPLIVEYLNRLSDWLFVEAREANQREGKADVLWEK